MLFRSADLGIQFPHSFRQKMMSANGGNVAVGADSFLLLPFFDTSNKKRLKRTCNSIVHETKYAREHYRLPSNIVIIGNNGGGDTLVYQIGDDGTLGNCVYWLDHETGKLSLVAEDFNNLKLSD